MIRISVKKNVFICLVIAIVFILSLYQFCENNPDRCFYFEQDASRAPLSVNYLQKNSSAVLSGHVKWLPQESKGTERPIDTLKDLLKKDGRTDNTSSKDQSDDALNRFERVDMEEVQEEEKEREEAKLLGIDLDTDNKSLGYREEDFIRREYSGDYDEGALGTNQRKNWSATFNTTSNLARYERVDKTIVDPGSMSKSDLAEYYNKTLNSSSVFLLTVQNKHAMKNGAKENTEASSEGNNNIANNSVNREKGYDALAPNAQLVMEQTSKPSTGSDNIYMNKNATKLKNYSGRHNTTENTSNQEKSENWKRNKIYEESDSNNFQSATFSVQKKKLGRSESNSKASKVIVTSLRMGLFKGNKTAAEEQPISSTFSQGEKNDLAEVDGGDESSGKASDVVDENEEETERKMQNIPNDVTRGEDASVNQEEGKESTIEDSSGSDTTGNKLNIEAGSGNDAEVTELAHDGSSGNDVENEKSTSEENSKKPSEDGAGNDARGKELGNEESTGNDEESKEPMSEEDSGYDVKEEHHLAQKGVANDKIGSSVRQSYHNAKTDDKIDKNVRTTLDKTDKYEEDENKNNSRQLSDGSKFHRKAQKLVNKTNQLNSGRGESKSDAKIAGGVVDDDDDNDGDRITRKKRRDDRFLAGRTMDVVQAKHDIAESQTDVNIFHNTSKPEYANKSNTVKRKLRKRSSLLFFKGVSCRPLNPKLVLFNRIFKTGSTSLNEYLREEWKRNYFQIRIGTTEDWYKTGDSYPYPDIIERFARKSPRRRLYSGHFYFRKHLKIKRPFTYINQVREPLQRILSHYFYMRQSSDRPKLRIEEMIETGEYNESLAECFQRQHRGCESNVMTRFFCGEEDFCSTGSAKALQRAKYNMQHYYAAIGLTEHLDLYLEILKKRLPKYFRISKSLTREKTGKTKAAKDRIPDEVKEDIKKANKADYEIYEFARTLFNKQLKACNIETEV